MLGMWFVLVGSLAITIMVGFRYHWSFWFGVAVYTVIVVVVLLAKSFIEGDNVKDGLN